MGVLLFLECIEYPGKDTRMDCEGMEGWMGTLVAISDGLYKKDWGQKYRWVHFAHSLDFHALMVSSVSIGPRSALGLA